VKTWAWVVLSLSGVAALSCSGARAASPKADKKAGAPCQPYQLTFAPSGELTFRHRLDVVRRTTIRTEPVFAKIPQDLLAKPTPARVEKSTENVQRTELVAVRRTAEGFVVTTVPEPARVLRDAKPAGLMAHVPLETALTYRLDASGAALDVTGFSDIAERMLRAAQSDAERAVARLVTAHAFEAERKLEWKELVASGLKAKGCLGDAVVTEDVLAMPGGPLSYYRAVRPSSFASCALGPRCLTVEQRYHRSRMVLDAWIDDHWVKRGHAMDEPFVEGRTKVVVDPATARLASAETTRRVNSVRLSERQTVTTTTDEELRHSFTYP
jgi:hypothetical protein